MKESMKDQEQKKRESSEYTSEDIELKEGLEHVRFRPSMYIGNTSEKGLHHLIFEVVDNSVDESLAGVCKNIQVVLRSDGGIEVEDDGRGIPIEINKLKNISALEMVMTHLGAGGKFSDRTYKVSGGLHGVGVSVVNALSRELHVWVRRNGKEYFQHYVRGLPQCSVHMVGESQKIGTKVLFYADPQIFPVIQYQKEIVTSRLRDLALLNAGLKITFVDERFDVKEKEVFCYEGGIRAFVETLNSRKEILHDKIVYISGEKKDMWMEFAFQYTKGYQETIYTYANNIHTVSGGTHLAGLRRALTRVFNDCIKLSKLERKMKNFSFEGEDVREGITAILSIRHRNPQFEGQTKIKLGNVEARSYVDSIVSMALKDFLEENPLLLETLLNKFYAALQARKAAQVKRDAIRRGYLSRDSLPGKLADCSEKKPEKSELFLVEGDSAGGSAKLGRNREFQAILPLWGKMLNVEKAMATKVLENDKLQPIVATLGTGLGEDFELEGLRYHKIVIMADADVDGSHIRTLLLTFFYRYLRPLLEQGFVYIAMPPLYKLSWDKKRAYAYNDEEREKIIRNWNVEKEKVYSQRYKGLGEMNPDQLWETTMDPESRNIMRLEINDAEKAEETISILMGEKIEPRRKFIEDYALNVSYLDV